jgi:hypothetical protein
MTSIAPADERLEETAARQREATIRHSRSVTDLLDGRHELRGVLPLADLIHEAVRWAA